MHENIRGRLRMFLFAAEENKRKTRPSGIPQRFCMPEIPDKPGKTAGQPRKSGKTERIPPE